MADVIMLFGSFVFLVLFAFLLFVFIVFLLSRFMSKEYPDYEPEVSIVVPAYNEEKNISDCINSIRNLHYPKSKIDIIVVDDGSTDKTKSIVAGFDDVKLIEQNHEGKAEALNAGAKNARHDLVITIDADSVLDRESIRELVKPLQDPTIAASSGSCKVRNIKNLLTIFQNVEYLYNNIIRNSFTNVFRAGIWFFGALACYRKSVLEEVGYFKKDTLAEDADIALEINKAGFRTFHAHRAFCLTEVPEKISELYSQRRRWCVGVLQALVKNRSLFSTKSSPSTIFLFVSQFWWSFYSLISPLLIIYQIIYWMPSPVFLEILSYLFRWFSLLGPLYVIYKIPEWGISIYSFFGVLAGIISAALIISAIKIFKDKLNISNTFALFFYFPYTIILNMMIASGMVAYFFTKKRYFIG